MRTAMRTITNVSYDGRAVDVQQETAVTFTNNCDHIGYITLEISDMESHEKSVYSKGDGVTTDYVRGQTVSFGMSSLGSLDTGHDYICVPTIFQRQAGDMSSETSPGKYDVYMGGGRVQQSSTAVNEVYIDRDISCIITPIMRNSVLVGGCVLRLDDRDLLITAYDAATGKATVSGAKINGATSSLRATAVGEPYKLITNYLRCDPFVFYYRTTPSLTLSCSLTANGIEVTGQYSQAQGTELMCYRLYAVYNGNGDGQHSQQNSTSTVEHELKYSTEISDIFPMSSTLSGEELPAAADIYCEATTQDGVTVQTRERLTISAVNELTVTVNTAESLSISGLPAGVKYSVWRRQNLRQAEHEGETPVLTYVGYKYVGSYDRANFSTAEAGYDTTYQYIVCAADGEGGIYYGISGEARIASKKWSLQHLRKTGANSYITDGARYDFTCDVTPAAIETVIGSEVYGTEGRFPKHIHGSDRYERGSFTALLGSIFDREPSARDIERWTEFIAQEGHFLLKTENGDVKIVAITGDPARQYGTSLAEIGLVRVTYSWIEVDDTDRAVVR